MHQARFKAASKRFADQSIHACRVLARDAEPTFDRLVLHTRRHSNLMGPCRRGLDVWSNTVGLLALALHHDEWLRPVEDWMPATSSVRQQFSSLANHLLSRYPLPHFMASAWFTMPPGQRHLHHRWYQQLGQGQSVRSLDLPIHCTKAMAHWFLQAPDHFTVAAALRWGQVRGLGGDKRLAHAIVATRLGTTFEHEDFWLSVLRFFIQNPRMDLAHVGPIVDFLHHHRHVAQEGIHGGILTLMAPEQPDYTIRGRSVSSVLRQVRDWHDRLAKSSHAGFQWIHSPIHEFELIEGSEQLENLRRWTIRELLTSGELQAEGRAMGHCVAIYAKKCAKKQSSIWSLRLETDRGIRPVLTIEVDFAKRSICQARRHGNALPKPREHAVMLAWASKERLSIAKTL